MKKIGVEDGPRKVRGMEGRKVRRMEGRMDGRWKLRMSNKNE